MLRLDLTKIRSAQERIEQEYDAGAFGQPGEDFRVTGPVTLSFDIYKEKQHFRLAGQVRTTLELVCSRCLEPFAWPVDAGFDLRYQPQTGQSRAHEHEIEEDDLTTAYYENDEIDLGQLMGEQFYLALPMKPLCSEQCKGLCPVCGTNWNRAPCTCHPHWEDPRLAALKALKKES